MNQLRLSILMIALTTALVASFGIQTAQAQKIMTPQQACASTTRPDCIPIMTWLYNYCNDPVRVNEDQCVKLYVPASDSGTEVTGQAENSNPDSAVHPTQATPVATPKSTPTPTVAPVKQSVAQTSPSPTPTPLESPSANPIATNPAASVAASDLDAPTFQPLRSFALTNSWIGLILITIAAVTTGLIAHLKKKA